MRGQQARRRVDETLVREASERLTERDRAICVALDEHRVLTSEQLYELYFGSLSRAGKRLKELYELRAIERFRPYRESGSHPYHYVLDELGARMIAAERGIEPKELDWTRGRALKLASSSQLRHLVEANGFFTCLIYALRSRPATALSAWWGQRRCARTWGELVRPDGYGRLTVADGGLDFWLEWDRGTETQSRLADKLERYQELAFALERSLTLLIVAPGVERERGILRALSGRTGVRVLVTTAARHAADPPAANWLEPQTEARVALMDVATES